MHFDFRKVGARLVAFAPEDEGGAGGGGEGGQGGEGGESTGGAGDGQGGEGGAGGEGDKGGQGTGTWWEDKRFSDEQRRTLTGSGLTVDDPLDAVAQLLDQERAAQRRLGAKPDSLMPKPEEGQSLAEWRRKHAETFGLPENADGYKVERPESWPENAPWDDQLASRVQELGAKHAVEPELIQEFTNLYAEKMAGLVEETETQLEASRTRMMQELETEWGDQMQGNLTRAKQAASAIAEEAGFSPEHVQQLSNTLAKGTGDANVIKLFATIGEMMGEDSFSGGQGGGGDGAAGAMGLSPAEARAELQRLQSPDGEWFKATKENNRSEIERLKPRMQALRQISSQKKAG